MVGVFCTTGTFHIRIREVVSIQVCETIYRIDCVHCMPICRSHTLYVLQSVSESYTCLILLIFFLYADKIMYPVTCLMIVWYLL